MYCLSCNRGNRLWSFFIALTLTTSASRFDHFLSTQEQVIRVGPFYSPYDSAGPLNPPHQCLPLFGDVSQLDCWLQLISMETEEYQESRLREEIEEDEPPEGWEGNSVWFTAIREVRNGCT